MVSFFCMRLRRSHSHLFWQVTAWECPAVSFNTGCCAVCCHSRVQWQSWAMTHDRHGLEIRSCMLLLDTQGCSQLPIASTMHEACCSVQDSWCLCVSNSSGQPTSGEGSCGTQASKDEDQVTFPQPPRVPPACPTALGHCLPCDIHLQEAQAVAVCTLPTLSN